MEVDSVKVSAIVSNWRLAQKHVAEVRTIITYLPTESAHNFIITRK